MTNSNVREKAINLSVEVHKFTKKFSVEDVLSEMLTRSTADVAIKISQSESDWTMEKPRDLLIEARGKIAAVETQLLICVRINQLAETEIDSAMNLCAELRKILDELISEA